MIPAIQLIIPVRYVASAYGCSQCAVREYGMLYKKYYIAAISLYIEKYIEEEEEI